MTVASLDEHAQPIDLTGNEPGALSPWAPRPASVARYRLKALTDKNLEELCRIAYKHVKWEAGKYEGVRLTEQVAAEMTTDVVGALEALRLALVIQAHHAGEPTEHLRCMDLAGVPGYFKRHIGENR